MNQGTCETCRWWDTGNKSGCTDNYGRCRFNPPSVGQFEDDWPIVFKDQWCGQHTPKPFPATGEKGEGNGWPSIDTGT